jgi:hypothetical protein
MDMLKIKIRTGICSPACHCRGCFKHWLAMCDLQWTRWQQDTFFCEFAGFPCQCHSTIAPSSFIYAFSVLYNPSSWLCYCIQCFFFLEFFLYYLGQLCNFPAFRSRHHAIRNTHILLGFPLYLICSNCISLQILWCVIRCYCPEFSGLL